MGSIRKSGSDPPAPGLARVWNFSASAGDGSPNASIRATAIPWRAPRSATRSMSNRLHAPAALPPSPAWGRLDR